MRFVTSCSGQSNFPHVTPTRVILLAKHDPAFGIAALPTPPMPPKARAPRKAAPELSQCRHDCGEQRPLEEPPRGHPMIDTTMMPHLLDRIVDVAPHTSLVELRSVNRAPRERADTRLAHHIVLRRPVDLTNPGLYIHAPAPPTPSAEPTVHPCLALPGFDFLPPNDLEPHSSSVQEREHRQLARRPGATMRKGEIKLRKGPEPYTRRAGEWCKTAMHNTRVHDPVDLNGHWRYCREHGNWQTDVPGAIMSQTPGVKIVRITANGGAFGGLHHLPP